jgi:hypothetical protein
MTKEPNGNGPDLIVLGRDEEGSLRAGRFPASQAGLVAKAAKAMNLTVAKAEGAAVAELAKRLNIGRLYASGRAFVSPVGRKLYDTIVQQLKLAGQPVPDHAAQATTEAAPGLPATWDAIAVGHLVIAHDSANDGWWEAIVLARDGDMLTLKWRDYQQPNVVRHAGAVALLKPTPVS